ncbi:MAG: glucose-6-phosphate dehydrogenase [Chthonomonadales bacterium]
MAGTPGNVSLTPMLRPADPTAFVIFGASGDLTKRKLIPALYNLACSNLLPPGFAVMGFSFNDMTDDTFRTEMREWVKNSSEVIRFDEKIWDDFAPRLHYITADFEKPEGYQQLKVRLKEIDDHFGCKGNRLFYCATPPSFYGTIATALGDNGLIDPAVTTGWSRIIIEKPFGVNLQSARDLNDTVHKVFKEEQIYRIDHYLGKETVQNIMAFRFANSIIEPIWNRRYIDHVQITAAESLGVEHRGKYYEEAGCLRDMFQNHLLQLMALVAMDPPVHYDGRSVRDRKADVLRAIVPINPENLGDVVVRGQYGPGKIDKEAVVGYREEDGVSPTSYTETFVALKLMIDNWRWADVPFYLRSGKRMPKRMAHISIQFKRVPHMFFNLGGGDQIEPNVLTIQIQPDEGISLKVGAKVPGPEMRIQQVKMEFSYGESFGSHPATAYETLLLDAMLGDPTLFNRSDAVEQSWEVLAPVLGTWEATRSFTQFPNYAAGDWGPAAADTLLQRDGRAWNNV